MKDLWIELFLCWDECSVGKDGILKLRAETTHQSYCERLANKNTLMASTKRTLLLCTLCFMGYDTMIYDWQCRICHLLWHCIVFWTHLHHESLNVITKIKSTYNNNVRCRLFSHWIRNIVQQPLDDKGRPRCFLKHVTVNTMTFLSLFDLAIRKSFTVPPSLSPTIRMYVIRQFYMADSMAVTDYNDLLSCWCYRLGHEWLLERRLNRVCGI